MAHCANCEELKRKMLILEGALSISAEMAVALKPLFPNPESLDAEKRAQWQRVVNAVFKASEYADEFALRAWGGAKVVKLPPSSVTN